MTLHTLRIAQSSKHTAHTTKRYDANNNSPCHKKKTWDFFSMKSIICAVKIHYHELLVRHLETHKTHLRCALMLHIYLLKKKGPNTLYFLLLFV